MTSSNTPLESQPTHRASAVQSVVDAARFCADGAQAAAINAHKYGENLASRPELISCCNDICRADIEVPVGALDWFCQATQCRAAGVRNDTTSTACEVCTLPRIKQPAGRHAAMYPLAIATCLVCDTTTRIPLSNAGMKVKRTGQRLNAKLDKVGSAPTALRCPHCWKVTRLSEDQIPGARQEVMMMEVDVRGSDAEDTVIVSSESDTQEQPTQPVRMTCGHCSKHFRMPRSSVAAYSGFVAQQIKYTSKLLAQQAHRGFVETPLAFHCSACLTQLDAGTAHGVAVPCGRCGLENHVPSSRFLDQASRVGTVVKRSLRHAYGRLIRDGHVQCSVCLTPNTVTADNTRSVPGNGLLLDCKCCKEELLVALPPCQPSSPSHEPVELLPPCQPSPSQEPNKPQSQLGTGIATR